MTDNRTTELREKLTERGVKWWPMRDDNGEYSEDRDTEFVIDGKKYTYHEWGEWSSVHGVTPEQAIAATLGRPTFDANLEQALSFMRIWISDDAHLGESELSAVFEKAEGLRKLDAIESAIAATLGSEREKRLEKLVRIYGEISNYFCERFACCDAEFANCKYCIGLPQGGQCELGWCNDESRALGIEQPDYGGGECEPVNLEELYDRIAELEELVRYMWREITTCPDYTVPPCMTDGICERVRNLEIEVD